MIPIRIQHAVIALSLLLAGVVSPHATAQQNAGDLVTIEIGDLPIILSAPHGGRKAIPGVPVRQGEGVPRFNARSDTNTDKLTEQLANALEKSLGKRPYLVIARFHRKYADANRRDRDAFESPNAKATYDRYHQALAKARRDVIDRWGRGILLDIHGQAANPQAIFRGTQNGKTTTHLVNRFGDKSLIGQASLFGRLAEQGLPVIPATDSTDREHANYNGGYIVRTYGSAAGGTLDAIQLELGRELRSTQALPSTTDKLATSIAAFAQEFLPQAERLAPATNGQLRPAKTNVGVYCDVGAGASLKDLLKALQQFDDVSLRKLMADDIRAGALADLDVLIHPGGTGSGQGRHLREEGREKIREFIGEGGGFIGFCAGAYLASADYPWSLHVLDAKVLDRKHWARGKGMVDITLTEAGRRVLHAKDRQLEIFYAQGPLLAPSNRPDIADYQAIATYKTEIAKNGAPTGVMPGTTAIACGQFGRGRVFCFSPHPELTKGLESLVHEAIEHVKRRGAPDRFQPANEQAPEVTN